MLGSRALRELFVADLAVARGIASSTDVAAALQRSWAARESGATSVANELARIADLDPGALEAVVAEAGRLVAEALAGVDTDTRGSLRTMGRGRYREFDVAGEGGMGIVYLSLDTDMDREVAFKVVRPDAGERGATPDSPLEARPPARDTPTSRAFEELKTRFLQEAIVTGGLSHPGIVPVYELGQTPTGVPYYTMKFVRGGQTLGDALGETRGGPVEDRLPLLEPFLKLCDAVAYAHSRGVIHRDLKPDNVALGEFGEVVLLDWGLAKLETNDDLEASAWQARVHGIREEGDLDTRGGFMGTFGYASPEAALGQIERVDAKSDVYSLGAVLYEILTGKLPHEFTTYSQYLDLVSHQDPTPARDVDADVPARLSEIAEKCLARERPQRTERVRDLSHHIRTWQVESARDREIAQHLVAARTALDDAAETLTDSGGLSAGPLLARLDRVTGPLSRVLELVPDQPRATEMQAECQALRLRAVEERARAARRSTVKKAAVVLSVLLLLAGTIVAWLFDSRRRSREESTIRALVIASRAEGSIPDRSLLLACAAAQRRADTTTLYQLHETLVRARLRATLQGHTGILLQARFSPDGRHLATASADRNVALWSTDDWTQLHQLAHDASVSGLAWSGDGRRLLTACRDGTAHLWDTDGSEIVRYDGHAGWVREARFDPAEELVLTVCPEVDDTSARLFTAAGREVAVLGGHQGGATHGLFAPDGERLLTVDTAGVLRLWDRRGGLLQVLRGHTGRVNSAEFSPDGDLALTASVDGTACIWDLESGEQVVVREVLKPGQNGYETHLSCARFLPVGSGIVTAALSGRIAFWTRDGELASEFRPRKLGPGAAVTDLEFSPDGSRFAWLEGDGSVYLSRTQGAPPLRLGAHTAVSFDLAFSSDGRLLATASNDGTAKIWSTEAEEVATHHGEASGVRCLVLDPAGGLYAVGRANGHVELWTTSGQRVADLAGHTASINGISWAPSGNRLVTAAGDGTVREWTREGAALRVLGPHGGQAFAAAYAEDGASLWSTTIDGVLYLWGADGSVRRQVHAHAGPIHCLELAPDRKTVLTTGADGAVRVWSPSGERQLEIDVGDAAVVVARYSPDGRLLFTGSHDGTVHLYWADGTPLVTPTGHENIVIDGSFSPDGERFLTVSAGGTAHLYDRSGELLTVFAGHSYWVVGGAFAPDGRSVATASWDGTARLWNLDGACTGVLAGHEEDVWALAFASEYLLTGSDDGAVKVWFHRPADLLRLARERAGRDFTAEELARYGTLLPRKR